MICQSQNSWHFLQIFEYTDQLVMQTHHIQYDLWSQSWSQNHHYAVFYSFNVHNSEQLLSVFQDIISVLILILFLTSACHLVLQEHSFSSLSSSWQFCTDQVTNSWVFNLQCCLSYTDCYTEVLNLQFYNSDSWHAEHCQFSLCLAVLFTWYILQPLQDLYLNRVVVLSV